VQSVEPGSPAARTGLVDGDLLVRFGDAPIESVEALHKALRTWDAGKTVTLGIIRRGVRVDLQITPALTQ
jgi:S1-C subfamily serine protease